MKSYYLTMIIQIVSFVFILAWVTGALIVVYQFFREYKGKKYNAGNSETDRFKKWKIGRNSIIRRGLRIFIAGISFQIILIIVQYFIPGGK